MDIVKDCEAKVLVEIQNIINELKSIEEKYNNFFIIDKIFSSENGGKTKINRQLFNQNHDEITEKITLCKEYLDNSIEIIKVTIKNLKETNREYNKIDSDNLQFDDKNFLELLELDANTHELSKKETKDFVDKIKHILLLKNRIYNFYYYIDMIDTTIFNKIINNLGIEELINSIEIFGIINGYGLQLDFLHKFKQELYNLEPQETKIKNLYFFDTLFELYKKRAINFNYGGTNYKIMLEYDNNFKLNRTKLINISYLENIISCLIEQSCMDIVKKEIKKGRIQKLIEIKIKRKKGKIEISIINNGFEVKNIYHLSLSNKDNKNIVEAKNLTNIMGIHLEINELEVGMEYKIII